MNGASRSSPVLAQTGPPFGQSHGQLLCLVDREAEDLQIASAAPGWFRLRIGEYRICYYRARHDGPGGPATVYAVERIVPRGAFDAAALSLPEQR